MRRWVYVGLLLTSSTVLAGSGGAFPAREAGGPSAGGGGAEGEDLAGRRSIRGEAVEYRESEALRRLREFEEESFPRRWVAIPEPRDAGAEEEPAAREPVPAAAPWLLGLELPDVPVRFDPRVVRYLEFYRDDRRGRAIMTSWLKAQGRYRTLIESALREARLPEALLYIAMIESGYDPYDRSHAGAVGLWQFMPEGGRIYGLRIDYWVDERRDPERATAAQMRYFGDLKARFGSWHLALAAFNHGYGAVLRAVAKYNTNDYWALSKLEGSLPWETTLYVPKFLAAAIVGYNRERFGYADIAPDPPWSYDRVTVPSSTSFAAIAKAAGVTVGEIAALNPELRRGRTPPEPWALRLPRQSGGKFLASIDKHRENISTHEVRFGERIDDIAAAAGATARELRRMNGITDIAEVRPGLTLVVPSGRAPVMAPGDDEIALVAVPNKDAVVAGRRRVFYRVLPGDGLRDVASFFKITVGDLARWNHLDLDAKLTSKMVLQVWVAKDFDTASAALLDPARVRLVTIGSEEFFDLVEARRGRKRLVYKVRPGDTLKKIAARYHLTEGDLERINRFGRKSELSVGQPITVYVAMTAAEKQAADEQWKLAAAPAPAAVATETPDTPRPAPEEEREGEGGEKPDSLASPEGIDQNKDAPPHSPVENVKSDPGSTPSTTDPATENLKSDPGSTPSKTDSADDDTGIDKTDDDDIPASPSASPLPNYRSP